MDPLPSEHPEAVLDIILDQDREFLGRMRACLDWSVQQTFASWIKKHKGVKPREIDPNVFAADVRQSVLFRYREAYPASSTRLRKGFNCGIETFRNGEVPARVRKHPRILRTAFLLPITPYPYETLFGEDFTVMPWRPYIIWEPDFDSQSLRDAWLAAIAKINNVRKTTMFCKKSLPPAQLPPVSSSNPSQDSPEDGNWPEWPVEGSGDEPA